MTAVHPSDALPGFAFGSGGIPLAWMGGGLIVDSGEAENTFPFRCQDRFVVYSSLLELRSVLLVMDSAHEVRYRQLVCRLNERLCELCEAQGLAVPQVREPLYVRTDLSTLTLMPTRAFARAAEAIGAAAGKVMFLTNQISPTTAAMLASTAQMLRGHGVAVDFDTAACLRLGALALRWHNKARFLELQSEIAGAGGPPWVPSARVPAADFAAAPGWAPLALRVAREWQLTDPPTELFVKSAQDSGGNVTAILSAGDCQPAVDEFLGEVRRWLLAEQFDQPGFLDELRAECELPPSMRSVALHDHQLAALRRRQGERRVDIPLLVQPVLRSPRHAGSSPASVGISFQVEANGACRLLAAAIQIYRDPQRRQFLGLALDDALLEDQRVALLVAQCEAVCRVLARHGFRGPVNLDACLGPDGKYWFTGDCNPRLTAVFVPLAARSWLARSGVRPQRVISFGYRGEFILPDARATLDRWADAGLLFGRERGCGMLVLPNLARADGHDVIAINLDLAEATTAFRAMRRLSPAAVPAHVEALHA